MQRPDWPRININAPLAGSLLFAGLGGGASTLLMADASGWGNHGALTNMDPASAWIFDSRLNRFCIQHDGIDGYFVSIGGFPAPPWTIAAWAKPGNTDADAGYQVILAQSPYTSTKHSGVWQLATDWYYQAFGISGEAKIFGGGTAATGVWRHLCVTSASEAFVDGASSMTGYSPVGQVASGITSGWYSGSTYYDGSVADLLVFNRILSPAEIQQLADPSNVMLSGLILPPRRVLWPAVTAPSGDATYNASALNVTSAVVASTPSVTVYPAALEVAAAVVAPIPIISISLAAIDITTSVETSTPIISISPSAIDITTSVETSTPVISISPSAIDTTAAVVDPVINTGENVTFQASPLSIVAEISGLPLRVNRTLNLVN